MIEIFNLILNITIINLFSLSSSAYNVFFLLSRS